MQVEFYCPFIETIKERMDVVDSNLKAMDGMFGLYVKFFVEEIGRECTAMSMAGE